MAGDAVTARPVSDGRILSILNLGMGFCRAVDSSGILRNATVRYLSYDVESRDWFMALVFPSGLEFRVTGVLSDCVSVCSGYLVHASERIAVPMVASGDVMTSFGVLSTLPPLLRSNLASPCAVPSACTCSAPVLSDMFGLCGEAMFFGVEGGAPGDFYRGLFRRFELTFNFGSDGNTVSAVIRSVVAVGEGRVVISSNVDFYGLNSKMVRLDYNLGMGRHIRSECFLTRDKKTVPSLRLAFDLADQLSGLYAKQRRKKESIGKPRSAVSK